jgi:hypothetical protein
MVERGEREYRAALLESLPRRMTRCSSGSWRATPIPVAEIKADP